ncbi:MAG: abortive infection family protein [Endomicrobium sp.]|jgi:hypothetical protein|nr:abortive infection family protein [Endomicrobium sp.]
MITIIEGHYDSALAKARTLVEEVFIYVIEKKGENPSEKGDIHKLYGQVKNLYEMHQGKNVDLRINTLLSGLEKIIDSIAQMRNEQSDSHGIGSRRLNLNDYHARLFVNLAMILADFILSVANKANK